MKRMRRITGMLAAVVFLSLLCLSCMNSKKHNEEVQGRSQVYIGVVLKSLDNQYFPLLKRGIEAEADRQDAEVICVSPNSEADIEGQAKLVNTMAHMAIDVFVVAPYQSDALEDALQVAQQRGIDIIAVDTPLDDGLSICYVGSKQYTAALKQGKYAALLGEEGDGGTALIVRGPKDDKAHNMRAKGLRRGLRQIGIEIADTIVCDSNASAAQDAVQQALEEHPDISVICTTSDPAALGAQVARDAAGMDEIHIVSFEGTPDVVRAVADGTIDAVLAQDPYTMGQECVRAAVAIARGEDVAEEIVIDTRLITQDDASAYLAEQKKLLPPDWG